MNAIVFEAAKHMTFSDRRRLEEAARKEGVPVADYIERALKRALFQVPLHPPGAGFEPAAGVAPAAPGGAVEPRAPESAGAARPMAGDLGKVAAPATDLSRETVEGAPAGPERSAPAADAGARKENHS